MEELEVILVTKPDIAHHIFEYPYNEIEAIRKHYELKHIKMGPLSNRMNFQYECREESDQLPPNVDLEGIPIQNRTYMTVCKLVGNKIYMFPVKNFIRIKPRLSKSVPVSKEKRSQAEELIYQRNKNKFLEQMKKSWAWQQQIKQSENMVDLKYNQDEDTDRNKIDEKQILNLKVMSHTNYQKMFYGNL